MLCTSLISPIHLSSHQGVLALGDQDFLSRLFLDSKQNSAWHLIRTQ
jgi:hypothetical protein